jgi:hypothetical protein
LVQKLIALECKQKVLNFRKIYTPKFLGCYTASIFTTSTFRRLRHCDFLFFYNTVLRVRRAASTDLRQACEYRIILCFNKWRNWRKNLGGQTKICRFNNLLIHPIFCMHTVAGYDYTIVNYATIIRKDK